MTTRKNVRGWVAVLMGLLILASAAPAAIAQSPETGELSPGEYWDPPSEGERAIGVFGAALCGAEGWLIRTNPMLGMHPFVLAAGIGGCLLVLLDVATT